MIHFKDSLSSIERVSHLQRRVLLYSIMYYSFDETTVSDFVYDEISKQLVREQNELTQEEKENTRYWYAMSDFEGSTGFHLTARLTDEDREYLRKIAATTLKYN